MNWLRRLFARPPYIVGSRNEDGSFTVWDRATLDRLGIIWQNVYGWVATQGGGYPNFAAKSSDEAIEILLATRANPDQGGDHDTGASEAASDKPCERCDGRGCLYTNGPMPDTTCPDCSAEPETATVTLYVNELHDLAETGEATLVADQGSRGVWVSASYDRPTPETQDGWQPIETAPKDGRAILASFGPYKRTIIVTWHTDLVAETSRWESEEMPSSDIAHWGLSHWMSLPEPPTSQEGDGQ